MSKNITPLLQKELHILFLSNAFLKMYIDDSEKQYDDIERLCYNLGRKSRMFSKQLNNSLKIAFDEFDKIQDEFVAKAKLPKKRFEKRVTLNEDGDMEVHAVLFATSLILEHKELKRKKLFLPYKEAMDIYSKFDGMKSDIIDNARILASAFMGRI